MTAITRATTRVLAVLALAAAAAACSTSDPEPAATGGRAATAANMGPGAAAGALVDGITVAGAGQATGQPDVARITVGVEVERPDAQTALDDANATTEQVLATLDEAGIAEEDRQTRDFAIHPAHRRGEGGQPEIRGYVVRNLVEATVRDIGTVGQVLQAAAEAGGDDARVHGVRFDLEDDGEQLAAAREAALEDARLKAAQYAELAGATLGELVAIEDQTTGSPRDGAPVPAALDEGAARVPIEPGEQAVTVRVTTRWTLQ